MAFAQNIQRSAGASVLSLFLIFSFGTNAVFASNPFEELRERFVQEAQKKSMPAVRYIPNREYDLKHVALDLRFDWNAEQVLGTAALSFAPLLADTRRVSFDAAKTLKLNVKQTQKRDETSDYPQVEFFQTPVEVEIGTASGVKVERIRIEPKAEQSVSIAVDGEPLLVNWDYQNTLIDEVKFGKSVDELAYQLKNDPDAMGRWWALNELKTKLRKADMPDADKQKATAALNQAITSDKFYLLRRDAITAVAPPAQQGISAILSGNYNNPAKPNFSQETVNSFLTATKDEESNVRAFAIDQLGRLRDAKYAETFAAALGDRSYSVVDAAAKALGATRAPQAYEQISRLLEQTSWRDRIRAAALKGFAETGDKRAAETGFKYAGDASANIRKAALGVLAETGKGDERVFPLLFKGFKQSLESNDFNGVFDGLVGFIKLGDPRGQEAFDLVKQKINAPGILEPLEKAFKQTVAAPKPADGAKQ